MPPLTETVKHLIIINVMIFLAFMIPISAYFPDFSLYWPKDPRFAPYQLVTHMFTHYQPNHLLFNMFALYIFGVMVERYVGKKKFLTLYLVSGVGSLLAHIIIQYVLHLNYGVEGFGGAVGASGAIMGVTIAYAVMFPDHKLMLLFPPIPIKAKYLAIAYVAFDLYSGLSGANNGVANWAHLGGALTGFIIAKNWLKRR